MPWTFRQPTERSWQVGHRFSGSPADTARRLRRGGLSRDVCAIHRCAVGLACDDNKDPFFEGAFAAPDLVIASNFPCMSEAKSFLYVVDRYKCPSFFMDAPINTWGKDLPEHAVKYYVRQLEGVIGFLEEHGYKLDWQRLKDEVAFTKALYTVLDEIEVYKKAVPSPMRAFDSFIAATAPLALPQSLRKLEIFERLRDELKEKVERGIGVVEEEKARLLWIGVPPVCDFGLLNYTEQRGAVVVKNMLEFLTGFSCAPELLDPDKPLESIARSVLSSPANPTYGTAIDYLVQATKDYKIDGAVSVVKRSCGLIPGMQRLTKEAIFRETGVPSIVFDLDGVDEREYDEAATKANLDSFVETLLARKGA